MPRGRPRSEASKLRRLRRDEKMLNHWSTASPDKSHEFYVKWINKNITVIAGLQVKELADKKEKIRAISRSASHRRRARKRDNGYEPYSEVQVLLKYGKNCHICNTAIDLKAPRRVGFGDWFLSLHIDHLIPIAKGGPDTLENVRPAHAICNLRKGAS